MVFLDRSTFLIVDICGCSAVTIQECVRMQWLNEIPWSARELTMGSMMIHYVARVKVRHLVVFASGCGVDNVVEVGHEQGSG